MIISDCRLSAVKLCPLEGLTLQEKELSPPAGFVTARSLTFRKVYCLPLY